MSKYITVTRDGRVAAPVYGGLDERGPAVGGPARGHGPAAPRYALCINTRDPSHYTSSKQQTHTPTNAKTNILLFPSKPAYPSGSAAHEGYTSVTRSSSTGGPAEAVERGRQETGGREENSSKGGAAGGGSEVGGDLVKRY